MEDDRMDIKRRNFNKLMLASVAGIMSGLQISTASAEATLLTDKVDSKLLLAGGGNACKGMNECKGKGGCKTGDAGCAGKNSCKAKGGCATVSKHSCKGQNECKAQGGCKTGDNGCAGKNSCKAKGGCEVPVNPEHMS